VSSIVSITANAANTTLTITSAFKVSNFLNTPIGTDGVGDKSQKKWLINNYIDNEASNTYDPTPVPQSRTFPRFSTLKSNYPLPYNLRPDRTRINLELPLDDFSGENFKYFNQCAIRVSISLTRSGVSLRGVRNITYPGGQTYSPSGQVLGATNLANYLRNFSQPRVYNGTRENVRSLIAGKTGIIYFENFIETDINGRSFRSHQHVHVDLWDRSRYMANFPFSQMFGATKILFWEIQ